MLRLITKITNEVVWVESEDSIIFGVVNAFKIIDQDGLAYQGSAVDILDGYTDIDQDWENESNIIKLKDGEILTLTAEKAELS